MKYRCTATVCVVFGLAMLMIDQAALAWLSFVGLGVIGVGYAAEHGGHQG